MDHIDIKFSKILSIGLIIVGALLAILDAVTAQWLGFALGILLVILGVLSMVNPVLRITGQEVQQRNLLGMTVRRSPITDFGDLRIDGKSLQYAADGRRIASLGFGMDKAGIEQLRSRIAGTPTP